ncbi:MarR family winged helix-turn-helix transcriptional regulator [Streptomyces sp. 1222.5]|uniref:MarR family winged helix-turn-helix transcriptional regulator n=1 Tax=Streptomyces sp. 1222.5 TaxID=1881026 RepID=UPI003EC04064
MRVRITPRRLAILTAIHESGETRPSGICHATGYGPGAVYQTLLLFERAGWVGRKPDPTRPVATLYHLTPRGHAGLQPKGPNA